MYVKKYYGETSAITRNFIFAKMRVTIIILCPFWLSQDAYYDNYYISVSG